MQVAVENLPLQLHARYLEGSTLWEPPASLNNNTIPDPIFRGTIEQLYRITVISGSGCLSVDTQSVKVIKQISVYVPTAFTPNADGTNDVLRPIIYGIRSLNYFRVFNRRGQLVFQTNIYNEGWNGYFKSVKQDPQTFVWTVEYIGADGNKYSGKGTSILLH
jgi:gliding motility-associated-like protein